jgi:hypothetical protein
VPAVLTSSLGHGESYAVIAVFLLRAEATRYGSELTLNPRGVAGGQEAAALAISTGRPIRPKGVCEIANGVNSADPDIAKPSVSVAQGTAFTRVFLGPSSADNLYVLAPNYSSSSCFGKNTGKPTRMAIAPAFLRAVSALPAQTGCGAALRNTRPAKSCSSIENHHADLQPERWPRKAGTSVRRGAGH